MRKLLQRAMLLAAALVVLAGLQPAPAAASPVLVFGDYSTSVNALAASLGRLGDTVTTATTLPASISGYTSVWSAYISGFTSAQESELANYVQAGGGLYLSGDNTSLSAMNASDQAVVVSVLSAPGSLTMGAADAGAGPYNFSSQADGGAFAGLPAMNINAGSTITGISNPNILVTDSSANTVAGIWGPADMSNGKGNIIAVMDVNWLGSESNTTLDSQISVMRTALGTTGSGPAAVPSPGSLPLLASGLLLLALMLGTGSVRHLHHKEI